MKLRLQGLHLILVVSFWGMVMSLTVPRGHTEKHANISGLTQVYLKEMTVKNDLLSLFFVVSFSLFWGVQAQNFFAHQRSWWARSVKKNWPLTLMGQISQPQNAILEIAFLSTGLLHASALSYDLTYLCKSQIVKKIFR